MIDSQAPDSTPSHLGSILIYLEVGDVQVSLVYGGHFEVELAREGSGLVNTAVMSKL